ncbi:hypothetical protein GJ496_010727 [Pomphorhynchus laevis]|nr:hypothetical protein GJ496_010727 [Pomphorhynchus laevis]
MDDYDQMRVVDLQAECKKHGLDHRGKKNELIERLKALPDAQTALSTDLSTALSTASSIADSSNASSKDGDEDQVKDESVKSNEDVSLDVSKEEDLISESELTPSVDDIKEGADNESNTVITADSSPRSQSEYSRKRPERSISHEHSKSRSPPPRRRRSVSPECVVPDVHKYESVDVSRMYLNNYTADLNLILSDDCLSTQINSDADLSSLYACVTGSHYIPLPNDIKVGFTVKLNTSPSSELLSNDFECQIGWTLDESNNHHCLGEQQLYSNSFIYSSDGKKCNKSVFEDYFESFTNEDTITALANFADGLLTLQFAKNGKLSEEMAYTIAEDKLEVSSPKLCPYIAVRNCMFEVNFGQATGEMVDEYQWIDMCELKQRCAFSTDSKSDYEVVLMVGLPAAGKSFQTAKMIGENSDKHYYVISYENVQNRFKMAKQQSLVAKKDNVTLSHDQRDRAFNCFKRMVEEAPKRPRNYIIDNCNITREMRRKMLGPFKGFHRKAVIVVPEDSVYQQRLSQSECGKQVVLDMKSAMSLPGMDDVDEIYFAELDDDDARQLIEKYNKEGYSSKRRSERSPRNYDRYNRRSSPRSRDQRQQSSQRSRYGSSRRDWRNDSSSRMEPSRFQPRRVSPQFGRRSGMNVASGYDYGRFYGNEHRLGPYSGGQGMYGRQRRSMSPTSRQPPNAVGGSWNFSPAGPSQSGGAYRQRLF